ncbi:MAG: signal peptide peptidase SppA [Candidatus Micrarchaeota archaeon]
MAEEIPYRRKAEAEKGGKRNYFLYIMVIFLSLGFIFLMLFGLLALSKGANVPFGKCVGVVEISGPITTEEAPASLFSEGMAGSYDVARRIGKIDSRDDVGAVLFVVNSPGGSVVATNEIYRAVNGLEKPKVAYFREAAASGAYYISTPADYIISEPNALTGSIGVIMTAYEMEGLFSKIGVNEVSIASGELKDMGTPFRNMTGEEKALLGEAVNETFEEFKSVVLEHRGGKINQTMFWEVTDGRVLTGRMALSAGLVDALGSREDALAKAAELGGIGYEGDVPVCAIDVSSTEAGLFNAKGLLGGIGAQGGGYRLEYR